MLSKVKPTATRNIILIRHGQYHLNSEKKNLTELGFFFIKSFFIIITKGKVLKRNLL